MGVHREGQEEELACKHLGRWKAIIMDQCFPIIKIGDVACRCRLFAGCFAVRPSFLSHSCFRFICYGHNARVTAKESVKNWLFRVIERVRSSLPYVVVQTDTHTLLFFFFLLQEGKLNA